MRLFTTMSLTHSDGCVLYNGGVDHSHYWYDFWDAERGRPISERAQLYETPKGVTIDGLFTREFDHCLDHATFLICLCNNRYCEPLFQRIIGFTLHDNRVVQAEWIQMSRRLVLVQQLWMRLRWWFPACPPGIGLQLPIGLSSIGLDVRF